MRRKSLIHLALVAAVVAAVLLAPAGVARASGIGFTGEPADHFWQIPEIVFCKNGFTILADEKDHHEMNPNLPSGTGDPLPFSLRLGSSNPPVLATIAEGKKPPIAGGIGGATHPTVSGSATFVFATPQSPGTDVAITIERWDHWLETFHETEDDASDHSIDFDDVWPFTFEDPPPPPPPAGQVEDCTVVADTIAPTATASISPPPNANGWNNTDVTVQLNAADNVGGLGVKAIRYAITGAQTYTPTTSFDPSISLPVTAEGETTISYFPWDSAGNAGPEQTITARIDKILPATTATVSPPPSPSGLSSTPVTIQLNASDNLSGVQQITYSSTGAQPIATTTVSGASASINITAPGTTTISYAATDNAGNAEAAKTQVIQVTTRVVDGMQALYLFDENGGNIVHDRAGVGAPLDLTVQDPAAVGWSSSGLVISSTTVLSSTVPATRLTTAMSKTNELAIEAWITPAEPQATLLGRIVTLSADAATRDVTLAQGEVARGHISYNARLHTHHPGAPTPPPLASPDNLVTSALTHLVYTRDASGLARLYVNGVEVAHANQLGDLSTWAQNYVLALANEPSGDRPWLGTYHLVALYNRALSTAEVRQNFGAGPGGGEPVVLTGRQALYPFDENGGNIVHDRAGVGAPLDLTIQDPAAVGWSPSGLVISSTTVLSSTVPATRLTTAMSNTNELAIEAWITPSDPTDSGLGRIVTLSANAATRDVTLAQGEVANGRISYNVRLRTHHPGAPTPPTLASPDDLVTSALTHLVYTRDASGLARLYVNGVEVAHASQLGDLSTWAHSYGLALANEPSGDRPWLGTYHMVALYNRALSPAEVHQKFQTGP